MGTGLALSGTTPILDWVIRGLTSATVVTLHDVPITVSLAEAVRELHKHGNLVRCVMQRCSMGHGVYSLTPLQHLWIRQT